ncbi:MAG: hypothetical protein LUH07_11370, partial [Lachnospiraceae bacterium]|nr:hypothetical protein [Lachnospiraceae bacterium]
FLRKYVPELGRSLPVECVFQSGKVFKNGGPYSDLMLVTPREAKRDARLKASGTLVHFTFDGRIFPLVPRTFFYDYIYINALMENESLAEIALRYDAFTDVEFNPNASLNCQAKAAAAFVAISRMGLIDRVKDPDSFLALYQGMNLKQQADDITKNSSAESDAGSAAHLGIKPQPEVEVKQEPHIENGMTVKHRKFGEGIIIKMDSSSLTVHFPEAGEKELGMKWCIANCEFMP